MKEKIAFVPWSFIKVKCDVHKEELQLCEIGSHPYYCCGHDECELRVPDAIYEKLLWDTVSKLDNNTLVIGSKIKKRYAGRTYECIVLSMADGKQPELGICLLG